MPHCFKSACILYAVFVQKCERNQPTVLHSSEQDAQRVKDDIWIGIMACHVVITIVFILQIGLSSPNVSSKHGHPFSSRNRGKFAPHTCVQTLENKMAACQLKHLTEVPQDLHQDIQKLNLGGNDLTELRNSSFQQYSQLIDIDLSKNHILYIENGTFYPVVHLKRLKLAQIPHLKLTPEVFMCSIVLQVLDLRQSRLLSYQVES